MRGLGFRGRLVVVMAGTIVVAGAALLAVQYLVVQQLFSAAITLTAENCGEDQVIERIENGTPAPTGDIVQSRPTGPPRLRDAGTESGTGCTHSELVVVDDDTAVGEVDKIGGAVLQQSMFLADEVSGGLLLWSGVTLGVFTGVAVLLSLWLARRSLDRIGEVTATARDISEHDLDRRLNLTGPSDEIKVLGDTIDGMLDRLQAAFAGQDRFVANASHELRTPLTTTRTSLEIPLRHGDVPEGLRPSLERALRATVQSERLIAALLALARSRAMATRSEQVALADTVTEEVDDLPDEATLHLHLEPVVVAGDPVLLARAVRNLVDNAVRHNVPDGEIWVRCRREGALALVRVENTGAHIPDETVALLPEPFYRGDASRTSAGPDGCGLGLAIVQSIAQTHGGELRLAAREGGGLVATLALPALASQD